MAGGVGLGPSSRSPSTVRAAVTVVFHPQTYRNLVYLALALPLGVLYFSFVSVGLSIGVGLASFAVGVPIVLGALAGAHGFATIERWLTARLLPVEIEPPESNPFVRAEGRTVIDRTVGLLLDGDTWKTVGYLTSKLALGVVSFLLIVSLLVTSVVLLATPFLYDRSGAPVGLFLDDAVVLHPSLSYGWLDVLVGVETTLRIASWEVTTLAEAFVLAGFGACLFVVALNVLNAVAWVSGRSAQVLLSSGTATEEQPVDVSG